MSKLQVHFPHTNFSPTVDTIIKEKIQKILKKYDKYIVNVDFFFSNDSNMFNSKLVVKTTNNEFVASDSDASTTKSLYKVVRKMDKELSRLKEGFSKMHKKKTVEY